MTTHDTEQVVGYINPDGTGQGSWMTAQRLDPCGSCGQVHGRIRYQAERNPEGSQLREVLIGIAVLVAFGIGLWMWAGIAAVSNV